MTASHYPVLCPLCFHPLTLELRTSASLHSETAAFCCAACGFAAQVQATREQIIDRRFTPVLELVRCDDEPHPDTLMWLEVVAKDLLEAQSPYRSSADDLILQAARQLGQEVGAVIDRIVSDALLHGTGYQKVPIVYGESALQNVLSYLTKNGNA